MASGSPKKEIVRRDTYTASPDEVIRDPVITVSGPGYTLDKADYLILTRKASSSLIGYIAASCLGVAVVYMIEIVAKFIEAFVNKTNVEIELWKKWALGISLICSIIFFLAAIFIPNEKKKLLKKMKEHIESRPRTVESYPKYRTGSRRY